MKDRQYDFCGWATKNDLLCSDGRVIKRDAFKHNDGIKVPLVWQHMHNSPEYILGHAILENRKEGVFTYGYLNDSKLGRNAKILIEHGDIDALSIYANHLKQNGNEVLHGDIKEVSMVISGANPGASILFQNIEHSDDGSSDEAIIFTGEYLEFSHSDDDEEDEDDIIVEDDEEEDEDADETDDESEDDDDTDDDVSHADDDEPEDKKVAEKEKTIGDIVDSMTEEQQKALLYLVDEALNNKSAEHSDFEGDDDMRTNIFEQDGDNMTLQHAEGLETILADGKRCGSLRESYLQHAAEYGIDNIEWLFPEARSVNPGSGAPSFIKRQPDEWVSVVMNGVHHTPFSRIKMMFADLREDEARAKGYSQKGKLKKEEVFGLLKRQVGPTTVYKKQKLDRDDVNDITDFDVVSWLKGEMRMMLDEEIARAILFGDGRSAMDEDKIKEDCIIPIVSDNNFYSLKKTVTVGQDQAEGEAVIDASMLALDEYEGSGNTIYFCPNTSLTQMRLLKDGFGHRLYKDANEVALAMGVKRIVTVPGSIVPDDVYGVIVDLKDYNVGADKGGAVNMFDDFDIDYNQQKYLIETRCSGAITRPFAAIVLKKNV